MKNFFKPTILKVIIFFLFIFLTGFIPRTSEICSMVPSGVVSCGLNSTIGLGYPTFFGEEYRGDVGDLVFYPIYLIINIISFYLLSSVCIWVVTEIITKSFNKSKE